MALIVLYALESVLEKLLAVGSLRLLVCSVMHQWISGRPLKDSLERPLQWTAVSRP
jgi:hypothetical protein